LQARICFGIMADRDELLSQFTDVTAVDAERAKFYLESSAWQLEVSKHISQVVNDMKYVTFVYILCK
jgi:hypothetical protein